MQNKTAARLTVINLQDDFLEEHTQKMQQQRLATVQEYYLIYSVIKELNLMLAYIIESSTTQHYIKTFQ